MAIFRFIFLIIHLPIQWLINLLFTRKDSLLEWHFNYGPLFVKIDTKYDKKFLSDDLLIIGYILFLSRYFFICDKRQVQVVREFLLNEIGNSTKSNEIAPKLYEVIFQTLNQKEKDATLGLFKTYNRFFPMPPLTYSENDNPQHLFAKYTFSVYKKSGNTGLGHFFQMTMGPDIILLPLTVGILYEYVVEKLQNKDMKKKLDKSIIDLLKGYLTTDCRSMAGQNELPNKIIIKNNLNCKYDN